MTLMSNKDLMTSARQSLQGKWGKGAFAILIFICFIFSMSIVSNAILPRFLNDIFIPIIHFGVFTFYGAFYYGLYSFFLTLSRGQDANFSLLFSAFRDGRKFIRAIFAHILIMFFTLLWSLLFIIPGIIAFISYSMTFNILIDHPEMSALDAVTLSKKMMKGHKAKFFFLSLRFTGWMFLNILTLGIASFWISPYLFTSFAKFYDDVKANGVMLEETK